MVTRQLAVLGQGFLALELVFTWDLTVTLYSGVLPYTPNMPQLLTRGHHEGDRRRDRLEAKPLSMGLCANCNLLKFTNLQLCSRSCPSGD